MNLHAVSAIDPNPGLDVVHVIVHYRSGHDCLSLIQSLTAVMEAVEEGGGRWTTVVVDNGATLADKWHLTDAALDPHVRLVEPGFNAGYLGAVRWVQPQLPVFDWLIVSNCDLLYVDGELQNSLRQSNAGPNVGGWAPQVVSDSGWAENPYLIVRPELLRALRGVITLSAGPLIRIAEAAKRRKRQRLVKISVPRKASTADSTNIYAGHGSCFALHRRFFERGGHLRWDAFLFGEELFVAEQMRLLALDFTFDPAVCFLHNEHASTGTTRSRTIIREIRKAAWQVLRLRAHVTRTSLQRHLMAMQGSPGRRFTHVD